MAFTPDQERMIQLMFEEQTAGLRSENQQLKQQLAILSDGSTISRSEYQALQDRLRQEQDRSMTYMRQAQDMESRMNAAVFKAQQLAQQINQSNDTMTNDIKKMQAKEAEVTSLKDQLQKMEEGMSKQRAELTVFFQEKNEMGQTIKDYEQVNIQLQNIVQELLEKDKQMTEAYTESAELMTKKDEEIDDLKRRIEKMKLRIKQHKDDSTKDATEVEISAFEVPHESSSTINEETREAMNKVKEQNEKMRKQMDKFNENKQLVEQLQKALETKTKQVENLQNLLEQEEKKTREYKQTTHQFNLEITKLHDKMRAAEDISELKISTMKQEMEAYKSQNEHDFQKREMLEREVIEMTRELNELRKLSHDIENGQFGLCDAIDQLKELKAMVTLRDQHIAVLVRELNAMDKMIDGLSLYIGPDFDMEKFIESVEDDLKNNNEKRMDYASKILHQRLKELEKTTPIGDIKIYLEKRSGDEGRLRGTLVETFNKHNDTSYLYEEDYDSDINEEPHSVVARDLTQPQSDDNSTTFENTDGQNTITLNITEESKTSTLTKTDERPSATATSTPLIKESPSKGSVSARRSQERPESRKLGRNHLTKGVSQSMRVVPPIVTYADSQTQCYSEHEDLKPQEFEPVKEEDHRIWLENLKNEYAKARKQNMELKSEIQDQNIIIQRLREQNGQLNNDLQTEREFLSDARKDILNLKKKRDEFKAQSNELTETLQKQTEENSKKAQLETNELVIADIEEKQEKKEHVDLKLHFISEYNKPEEEIKQPKKFLSLRLPDSFSIFPSPEELAKIAEEKKKDSEKYKNALSEVTQMQRLVNESQMKIEQKDRIIQEKDAAIARFETQLKEERNHFKERLHELQEDTQRTLAAQIREATAFSEPREPTGDQGALKRLPEVSEYINSLKNENIILKDRISELEDMVSSMKQQSEQYRAKIKNLEAQIEDQDSRPQREVDSQANLDYMKKLQRKNLDLKKKVDYLTDENVKLRAIRERRDEIPEMRQDNDYTTTIEKLTTQNTQLTQRYSKMKASMEELQQQLEKEKTKTERLKAVLVKKEDTVQQLTEKYHRYKHQNEKLRTLVKKSQ